MKTAVIVQARMSSSRFSGKMLADLAAEPLALHSLRRASLARRVDEVLLATSVDPSDDSLARVAQEAGYRVFRGSLEDVLGRFANASVTMDVDTIVRVTGDCPLVDPDVLDAMLERFARGDLDYLTNVSPPSYPDGLDLEILSSQALAAAHARATSAHHREHVTLFIRDNPDLFRIENYLNPAGNQAAFRWSVDHPEDLVLVADLLTATEVQEPRLADLISTLARYPDLEARSMGQRNEGAIRSRLEDLESRMARPRTTVSDALWERGRRVIPAGTQTLSKGPTQFVQGFSPKYIAHGVGSHVWDVDGNEFIDTPMGLGPVTLGHAHPEVNAAVIETIGRGTAFSWMHPSEVELAERIVDLIPCAERVRFGKNGSDATSACIRAARALTGRSHVARCGYHGWQDWSIDRSYGIRSKGVPEEVLNLTIPFPYNDLSALELVLEATPIAAVILEPISVTPPAPGYLEGVRELATRYGAVLIFDEVVTGFRYSRGGAQEYFGVTPDLCSMGKGVANGYPLSIVAGKSAFMEPFEEIFFSFTFGGETSALAAAQATLDVMERDDYWSHAWRQGNKLQEGFRRLAEQYGLNEVVDCAGMPPWTVVTFSDQGVWSNLQLKSLFQQEMLRFGVLFSGSQFVSLCHSDDDIERIIAAYREALSTLRFALDCNAVDAMTLGEPIELIFRRV